MSGEHGKGIVYSAALHFIMLLMAIFGLPSFLQRDIPPQPMVVSVDILPITDVTNVKTADLPLSKVEKEVPQEEAKKPTPPAKSETPPPPPEPKPPEPKKEEKPEPKPAEKPEVKPEPKPEPKPQPKPEKKPEPKEKPKKAKEQDLEAVLKSLREDSKKEQTEDKKIEKPTEEAGTKAKGKNVPYDPGKPMSMTELDAIRSQISKCWTAPAGAKNAHELQVKLRVQLQEDGTVIYVGLADESRAKYGADSFYRAAADSAMRAVRMCSPLKNLPADKFQTWKDMEMTFDPKEMLF